MKDEQNIISYFISHTEQLFIIKRVRNSYLRNLRDKGPKKLRITVIWKL